MNNLSLCSGKASSLREAGKMFNVPHCSVSELVKYRKQGRHGVGKKLKYLSEQEEKHIAERYIFFKILFICHILFFCKGPKFSHRQYRSQLYIRKEDLS